MQVNNLIPSKGAVFLMTADLRTSEALTLNPTPLSAGCLQHLAGMLTDSSSSAGRALLLELAVQDL